MKTNKSKYIYNGIFIFATVILLYLSSLYNYLLFHSLVELFSVVIAFGFFAITWNAKKYMKNDYLIFIGIAYFFIGILDIMHLLSFRGINIFEQYDFATQFWLSGRYLESISLVLAFLFIGKGGKLNPYIQFLVYSIITSIITFSIIVFEIFPRGHIEGIGLTPFKIYSEYLIIVFLISSLLLLYYNRNRFEKKIYYFLSLSLFTTILSEIMFTQYISSYDDFNLIGHMFKLLSVYFIYKAILETSIVEPFSVLLKEVKENEQQLAELNSMKDRFLSIIAHDLKNPFVGILSSSKVLLKNFDRIPPDQAKKLVKQVIEASESGNNLLENLLNWSRSQMHTIEYKPTVINLKEIVKETHNILKTSFEQKNIQFIDVSDEKIHLLADENMLQTVLRNLLTNAVKFTYPGGKVKVTSEIENEFIRVQISDTGIGMKKDDIINLFRIDRNVSRFGTAKEKGTGMGLLLTKEFVEKNGGTIWVESEEGKGSSFYFTVPYGVKE